MQLDAKTTWWLTFALMALQGLNSVAWTTLGVDPHIIAGISQAVGYATGLLLFAIHGSLPGVGPVQMPKPVIALAVVGTALLALLLPGTAHAGWCDNAPPLACENYVRTIGELGLMAIWLVGLAVLIVLTVRWGYRALNWLLGVAPGTQPRGK